jgi:SnoaL-like domain
MRFSILLTLLTNLIFPFLALGNGQPQNPSDILAIKNTLAKYSIAIDSKNFDNGLPAVFTEDAIANYTLPTGVLNGLPAIIQTLSNSLVNFTTQHSLTTQLIDIVGNNKAESVTYLMATHFGIDGTIYEGLVSKAFSKYEDKLRVDHGVWKIYHRLELDMVCSISTRHGVFLFLVFQLPHLSQMVPVGCAPRC